MRVQKKSRIIALILTLVLLFSMGGVVNAQDGDSTTTMNKADIIIDNIEDLSNLLNNRGTITAYKVIDANFSDNPYQPVDPVYTWDPSVAAWLTEEGSGYTDFVEERVLNEDTTLYEVTENFDSDSIKTFADSLAEAIRSGAIKELDTKIMDDFNFDVDPGQTNNAIFRDMEIGSYLILIEGGVKIYDPIFVNVVPQFGDDDGNPETGDKWFLEDTSIEVSSKAEEPTITKDVSDHTVAINDTVTFTLTIDFPDYPANAYDKLFVFGDRLPYGLTLDSDSIKIYNNPTNTEKKIELTASTAEWFDKVYSSEDIGDEKFRDTFEYSLKKECYDDFKEALNGATSIIVTYEATVNSNAYENKDDLVNTAYLQYDNSPYTEGGYVEKTDDEQVYTYALQVIKMDDNEGDREPLGGAEFNLYRHVSSDSSPSPTPTLMSFVEIKGEGGVSNGTYRVADANDSTATNTLTTSDSGEIEIQGLDVGTYTLTEVKAPDGYMLPADPNTEIVISDGSGNNEQLDGIIDNIAAEGTSVIEGSVKIPDDKIPEVAIENVKPTTDLPTTGGIGTVIFTVTGIIVMGGAVALLVAASRKKKNH